MMKKNRQYEMTLPLAETNTIRFADGLPELLTFSTLLELFEWYRVHLCGKELIDPRGQRVTFQETDVVHLIKLGAIYRGAADDDRIQLADDGQGEPGRRLYQELWDGCATCLPRSYLRTCWVEAFCRDDFPQRTVH